MNNVGEKLKNERKKNNITQKELAKILNTDKTMISKYENGHITPDAKTLKKYSAYFEKSIDYLLNNETNFNKNNFMKYYQFIIKYIYENFNDKKVKHLISQNKMKFNKNIFKYLNRNQSRKYNLYSLIENNIKDINEYREYIVIELNDYSKKDNKIKIVLRDYMTDFEKLINKNILYYNNQVLSTSDKKYLLDFLKVLFENQNNFEPKTKVKRIIPSDEEDWTLLDNN